MKTTFAPSPKSCSAQAFALKPQPSSAPVPSAATPKIGPTIPARNHREGDQFVVSLGLDAMYVTEDTTRCDPDMIKRLYSTAIACGARSIVICDTAGHSTPAGAFALIKFVLDEVVKPSGEKIRVDWHGHNDRGLAVANSLAALAAGADCVHASALATGERVGNTPWTRCWST